MPKFNVLFKKEVNFVLEADSLEEARTACEKTAKELMNWIEDHAEEEWWETSFCKEILSPMIKANSYVDDEGYLEDIDLA